MTQAPAANPTPKTQPITQPPSPQPSAERKPSILRSYITLAKPRITAMVILTVGIGFMFGAKAGWDGLTLAAALIGAALSCMGAGVMNQVYERDTDALMVRTQNRPMPTGAVGVRAGWTYGLILTTLGLATLAVFTTYLAAAISLFTVLSYALWYTPMKRTSHMATIVGIGPGALPPVLGYAAASGGFGGIGIEAVLIFAVMFVWQIPHTLAIYWLHRDDFAKAGFPMLPVIDPTGEQTFQQVLIGSLLLLPLGLTPTLFGVSGLLYFITAFACGLLMLSYSLWLAVEPTRQRARSLFFASLVYLPVVLSMMLVDRI